MAKADIIVICDSGNKEPYLKHSHLSNKVALLAGAAAIAGLATMTACGSDTKESPTDTKVPGGPGNHYEMRPLKPRATGGPLAEASSTGH